MATAGADLIRQMAAGDRQAFAAFYDRHAPVVFPLILRIVREPADASDVLQEVFWEAWRDAGNYDASRGSPEAWMITRARTAPSNLAGPTAERAESSLRPRERRGAPPPPAPRVTPPSGLRTAGRSGAPCGGCRTPSARSSSSRTTRASPRARSPTRSSSRSGL